MNKVVLRYLDGKDKIRLLYEVLETARFEQALEARRLDSGTSKANFDIVIKPNASMYIRRDEDGVTTDAILVLALVEWLAARGYAKVRLVESSNLYEAGFKNREPVMVMTALGLAGGWHWTGIGKETKLLAHVLDGRGGQHPYSVEDLGADIVEVRAPGMPSHSLKLGRAWVEADFRISFCAFKTHIYDGYTLLVKNTYGCLPEGNKMWHYHYKTGAAKPTIEQLKLCPVHFGIIDAITGADGQAGVKWDRSIPRRPGFIMAGANIGEVEKHACSIMKVKYRRSYMSRPAIEMLREESELDGQPRPLGTWINVWPVFIAAIPVLERIYPLHRCVQMLSDFFGSPPFRRKPLGVFFTILGILTVALPLMYALQKRHGVILIYREMKERLHLRRKGFCTPRAVSRDIVRLDARELGVLRDIIAAGAPGEPKLYGHRIVTGNRTHDLPDSSYFNLERIRSIVLFANNDASFDREKLIENISERIVYKSLSKKTTGAK
jgi:uncharacterized protein (DUF362 family)